MASLKTPGSLNNAPGKECFTAYTYKQFLFHPARSLTSYEKARHTKRLLPNSSFAPTAKGSSRVGTATGPKRGPISAPQRPHSGPIAAEGRGGPGGGRAPAEEHPLAALASTRSGAGCRGCWRSPCGREGLRSATATVLAFNECKC